MSNNSALKKINEENKIKKLENIQSFKNTIESSDIINKIQSIGTAKTGGQRILKMAEIIASVMGSAGGGTTGSGTAGGGS